MAAIAASRKSGKSAAPERQGLSQLVAPDRTFDESTSHWQAARSGSFRYCYDTNDYCYWYELLYITTIYYIDYR